MIPRLLACAVALAVGLGVLHVLLARRDRFRPVAFCAASGGLAVVLGLVATGRELVAEARLSWPTAAWIPAFALGWFAAGVVAGAAWLGAVRGGAALLARRRTEP